MSRALGAALVAVCMWSTLSPARAQPVPPPASLPQLPDEPLPEWKPPPPSLSRQGPLILGVAPELRRAERLRRDGLLAASFGLASLFIGGLGEAWAAQLNTALNSPRDGLFHPEVAEQRDRVAAAAVSFISVGGALTVGGFVVFGVGQMRIDVWHREHPRDQLPPLSGY
jgi:hypothetical protein